MTAEAADIDDNIRVSLKKSCLHGDFVTENNIEIERQLDTVISDHHHIIDATCSASTSSPLVKQRVWSWRKGHGVLDIIPVCLKSTGPRDRIGRADHPPRLYLLYIIYVGDFRAVFSNQWCARQMTRKNGRGKQGYMNFNNNNNFFLAPGGLST